MNQNLKQLIRNQKYLRAGSLISQWIYPEFRPRAWAFPRLQSHRGFCQGAPENTRESLRQARDQGYQMAEFDVRLTRDLVPVLSHDEDLRRVFGVDEVVAQRDFQVLKDLCPELTSLESVLIDPQVPEFLNIEIKGNHLVDSRLETLIVSLILKTKTQSRVMVSSFNPLSVIKIKKMLPELPCGLLVSSEDSEENKIYLKNLWIAPIIPFDFLHLDEGFLDPEMIHECQRQGIPVVGWTLNDKKKAQDLLGFGLSSVITDQVLVSDLNL